MEAARALGPWQSADHRGLSPPVVPARQECAVRQHSLRPAVVQHRPDADLHDHGLSWADRPFLCLAALDGDGVRHPVGRHLAQLSLPDAVFVRHRSGDRPAELVRRHRLSGPAVARDHAAGRVRSGHLRRIGRLAAVRKLVMARQCYPGDHGLVGHFHLPGLGRLPSREGGLPEGRAQCPAGGGRLRAAVVRHLSRGDCRAAQERRSEMGQDDQIRQGEATNVKPAESAFDKLLAEDIRRERRIFWCEVVTAALLAVVVAVDLMVR